MKTAVKLFTESIIDLIQDAQDNDLSFDFIKNKISIYFEDEFLEKEKQQIIEAYMRGSDFNNPTSNDARVYYNHKFKD